MPRDRKKRETTKRQERHLLKMVLDPATFSQLTPGRIIQITASPIPNGAIIIGAGYDHGRHSFVLVLEHESFDPVPVGELVPVGGAIDFTPLDTLAGPENGDPQEGGKD
jgi:hypothetical protein